MDRVSLGGMVEEMTENLSWYCPMPFKYLHVENDGVASCCSIPLVKMTIPEYLSSDHLRDLQNQFLVNQKPGVCQSCVNGENQFGQSLRTQSVRDFQNRVFTSTEIDSIDYRSSNICNFKCRMCSPAYSHAINQEVQQNLSALISFYPQSKPIKKLVADENDREWIIKNINQIKRFMFAGGEPTYMPEVRIILQKIIDLKKSDVQINFTSNCSFQDPIWYQITETVPNVHWTASIDAVGSDAELIRHGTDWPVVEKNVQWLACHANSLDIHTVITNLNIFRLKPLLRFVRDIQKISKPPTGKQGDEGARHLITVITNKKRPAQLAANNWPDDMKPKVIDYINECLDLDLEPYQQSQLTHLRRLIETTPFNLTLWNQTKQFNNTLDLIRNENYDALFLPAD